MLVPILAAQLVPVAYSFSPSVRHEYAMQVVFEGFIPILGGQEGKAEVKLGVLVEGLDGKDGRLRASSDLTSAEFLFNGAKLPLGLDNVKDFFPRTTIEILPSGKVEKTDAPDISLPIKLPGLDVKRFPDISYVPIEFGPKEVEAGTSWDYTKNFGGSPVKYTCKVASINEETITIELTLSQEYEVMENSGLEVVTDPAEAENRVKTTMKGTGEAIFDRKLGVVRMFTAKASSESVVTPIAGGATTTRKLSNQLRVELKRDAKR